MKPKTKKQMIVKEPPPGYDESAIVIYQSPEGIQVDVKLEKENIWLNLNQMAVLFDRDKSVISRHLHNVFKEKELHRDSTVAFFATVQDEGGRTVARQIEYYNLDAVISVGYRVNSKRGTQFRIWATGVLRDHVLKDYTIINFLIKDHPFVDGNKRIGAALFLWFLEKNNALYNTDDIKRISDSALVAMTLLIAESQPREKDILTRVLINLINRREP